MYLRKLPLLLLALFVCLAPLARADDALPLNQEYKGTTKLHDHFANTKKMTSDSVTIDVKAGQRIEVSVTMFADRDAAVFLWNPDGVLLGYSPKEGNPKSGMFDPTTTTADTFPYFYSQSNAVRSKKSAKLVLGEAPVAGKYKIVVYSPLAGDYVLVARDLSRKRDAATVEKELEAARQRVRDLEKELQELKKDR